MPNETIQINELFGPTIQGEGPMLGAPCFFIRLHNCPVKCPGCDTHYTWDGSESGEKLPLVVLPDSPSLQLWLNQISQSHKHCGIVLSGGEPLLHYKNPQFIKVLGRWVQDGSDIVTPGMNLRWLALETSGFIGPVPIADRGGLPSKTLADFLCLFSSISLSPKVTPCLHGQGWTREQLLNNIQLIHNVAAEYGLDGLFIKMVVRDGADIKEVVRCNEEFGWQDNGLHIYVMPYGQERDEILRVSEWLVPICAEYGFILTPRLHSLLWGKERMR